MQSSGKIGNAKDHLHMPDRKRKYNKELFTVVAPKYQFVTRALSFGRDQSWKSALVGSLPGSCDGLIVDLACGTGDICLELARRYEKATILGIDLTPGMLEVACNRSPSRRVRYVSGDMQTLCLDSDSVSIITGGYALRNAPDLQSTLKEISRVLKPGGTAAFLDFSKSSRRMGQAFEYRLLHTWGSLWGLVLHGNPAVYAYIAESLRSYPDRMKLRGWLQDTGLQVTASKPLFWGIAELTLCRKEPYPESGKA